MMGTRSPSEQSEPQSQSELQSSRVESASGPPSSGGGVGPRVRHLWVILPLCVVIAVVAAGIAALVGGVSAAAGAAAGVGLVTASYAASTLAIGWADSVNPRLVFPIGMAMYVTKFSLFGAMLLAIEAAGWSGAKAMAMGIVTAVVVWTAATIWWTVRTSHPYVGPACPPELRDPSV